MKKIFIITLIFLFTNSVNIYSQERSRSAKTGRYVSKGYANKHKSTTYTSKTKRTK